jgi:hypothetical protein
MTCEQDANCTFNCAGGGCLFDCSTDGTCDASCGSRDDCLRLGDGPGGG